MTPGQHRVKAERLLVDAEARIARVEGVTMDHRDAMVTLAGIQTELLQAQVHATLAGVPGE